MSLNLSDNTLVLSAQNISEVPGLFRALVKKALADPGEVPFDGSWVAFQTPGDLESDKPGRKAGYASLDPLRFVGVYGSHRPGECAPAVVEIDIPQAQRPSQEDREAAIRQAQEQRKTSAEEAALRAQSVWDRCETDLRNHPYLIDHGVLGTAQGVLRLFVKSMALVAPMRDASGKIWNRQAIAPDGRKRFLDSARLEGLGLWIPSPPAPGQPWYAVEGVAKALAVSSATGASALCAFTAGNLTAAIAEHALDLPPQGCIAADGDQAGHLAAQEAMAAFPSLAVVYPPEGKGDWNDLLVKEGLEALKMALQAVVQAEGPQPLRRAPPEAEPYPVADLGPVLSPAVEALETIIQAPRAMIAQSLLAAAAFCVQPFANVVIDGRSTPVSIYCVTIGGSGERKSAVDFQALKPIFEKQRELVEGFKDALKAHKSDLRDFDRVEKALNKERAVDLDAIRKNRNQKQQAVEDLAEPPEAPLLPNLLISEPTAEGMVKLFASGQPALGLYSDEGGLLLGGHAMQRETRLRTIATLSKLWDGRPIDRVRSGDGASILYDRRLSLHLMMQPMVASELFTDPLYTDQGFLNRVLIAWPESTAGSRRYVHADPALNPAILAYWQRLTCLLNTTPALREGTRNELNPRCLPLSKAAKAAWVDYADRVELYLASGQPLETVRGFASKAAEHVARIAGVLTLILDVQANCIELREIEAATRLMDYYLTEILRLQVSGMTDPELQLAERLRVWCQGREYVHTREIYQFGPSGIRDADTVRRLAGVLMKHGWLIKLPEGKEIDGVRRREVWRVVS